MTGAHEDVGALAPPVEGALSLKPVKEAAAAFLKKAIDREAPPAKLPVIQIDHKTGSFVLPSGEVTETVAGYPIFVFQTRRFYLKPPAPGESKGQPPDCWSPDLLKPSPESVHPQHPYCHGCPRAQWGTGRDGRSQACGTYTWVFLVNKELASNPPIAVLVAPPSSIRVLLGNRFSGGYFQRAQARHDAYEIVWTVFGLERAGELHCVLEPRMGPPLEKIESVEKLAALRNQFLEAMREMRGQGGMEVCTGGEDAAE